MILWIALAVVALVLAPCFTPFHLFFALLGIEEVGAAVLQWMITFGVAVMLALAMWRALRDKKREEDEHRQPDP